MSIPDAVLSAFIEAKGCREATRAVEGVQASLREATKIANEATAAVNRFGRVRGIAVLDVDAAKARAQTAAATKDVNGFGATHATATADVDISRAVAGAREATSAVNGFGHEHAAATLAANGNGVTRGVVKASAEVQAFGHERATAKIDVDTRQASRALGNVGRDADRTGGALRGLGDAGGGGSDGLATLRGSLGPLSGGLGALAGGALFLGVALLAVAGPAAAVTAALAPLVGLAAGAAGGLVAAAQGFGVFKLATMGVLDALKEQVKVSSQSGAAAISQAGQEQAAARAIAAAQEGVRSAREGVRRASESLTNAERQERQAIAALAPAYQQARRHIQDLGSAVTDSSIALRDARLRATEARAALVALLGGPSPRALADAHTAVTDALRGETSAARELFAAQSALADLLKPADALSVADAQDQVADALRGQTRAANDLADQAAATNAVLNDPSSTADQKARSQLALADAQNAVGDAARATEHAQRALNQLQAPPAADAVAAAQGRIADAQAGVSKATQATADATDALRKVQAGASGADIARARLDLAAAEQAVSSATRDSARSVADFSAAQAAGVARSPEVLAAREALRSATSAAANADRGLTTAEHQLVFAQQGVSAAQQDAARSSGVAAASAVDLNQKLNALPPAAQAFVKQLVAMKGKADELRQTAAAGFFPGAEAGLAAAARSFEPVKRVVAATAAVLGDLSKRAGELVGGAAFGKDIETIGTRNAKVLDTMGSATLHVVSALRYVLVAAGPLTQWLADLADKWALNAARSAKAGEESGKLTAFFERTRAVAERLGSILGHLAHGLFGIGKAGTDSGNSILLSIDRASKRFDEWANSVKGQSSIREFFQKTKEIAAQLLPALGNLATGFAMLALRLLPVTTALRLLGPLADEAIIAFVAFKLAMTAAAIASKAWAAGAAIAAFATGGWTTAFWALNAAMSANPIGLVVIAIAALIAGLILAYKNSETFRAIVDGALRGVADAFNWMWNAAKDVFNWLTNNWPLVLAILTGPIGLAVLAIKQFGPQMLDAAKWLLDQFITGVKAVAAAVVSVGGWIVNKIVEGIKAIAGFAADVGGWIKNRVVEGVMLYLEAIKAVGGWILNRIVDGFKVVGEALLSVGGWLKNRIVEIVHLAIDGFTAVGGWILNKIVDGFKVVTEAMGSVGGWLKNRLSDAFGSAKDGFLGLGGTIMGWIVDGLKKGANHLVGFLNSILGLIEKIPGIKNGSLGRIPEFKIDKNAKGGTFAARGGMPGATEAFAHGGAFARTGGFIDQPITLMGEEAPQGHPEWVIPTNPSYRGRALKLWQKAGQSIGAFASGGVYGKGEIEKLWTGAGGNAGSANTAAAVALAESSGRAAVVNSIGATGLWQVLKSAHPDWARGGDLREPHYNARAAVDISSNGANWNPWEAFTSGAYKKFLGGGGILSAIGGAISGGAGAVGGVLGDLLSKGAGFLLDQLPGVGDLPDWLQGTGKYVLDAAGDWIKSKVSDLVGANQDAGGSPGPAGGPSGVSTFDGVQIADWVIGALKYGQAHGAHGHPTSGYRPGFDRHTKSGASEHQGTQYPHGAVDFGSFTTGLAEKMSYVKATRDYKYPLLAPQGFRDDGHASGTGHKMGGIYGGVLSSFANGTDYVPRTGPYELHRGEAVTSAAENAGGSGNVIVQGDMVINNRQDADVLANRLAFKLKYSA